MSTGNPFLNQLRNTLFGQDPAETPRVQPAQQTSIAPGGYTAWPQTTNMDFNNTTITGGSYPTTFQHALAKHHLSAAVSSVTHLTSRPEYQMALADLHALWTARYGDTWVPVGEDISYSPRMRDHTVPGDEFDWSLAGQRLYAARLAELCGLGTYRIIPHLWK